MAIDGIWTGELLGPYEWENNGVYILEKGRIVGGNDRHYSMGSFDVSGDDYSARLHVHYYGQPRAVFSDISNEFEVTVAGKLTDNVIEAKIARVDRPGPEVIYRMTKRMDLPATAGS